MWIELLAQAGNPAPVSGASGGAFAGDAQAYIVWGVVLLAAALLLGFTEIFVPSGGLVGVLAVIAGASGVVMLFLADPMLGLAGSAALVVLTPVLIMVGLKVWPYTPVGRRLLLSEHQETLTGIGPDGVPRSKSGVAIGARGVALSTLRPMGTCRIDGQVVECMAQDAVIEPDTPVVVSKIDGWRVIVREAEPDASLRSASA